MTLDKHIKFLDGLRGVAALAVVLSHVTGMSVLNADNSPLVAPPWFLQLFRFMGSLPVPTFIVLSGLVLTLPIVRRGSIGSITDFYKRRCRRILPAYWAALFVSAGVAWGITGKIQAEDFATWLMTFPLHIFLLQDVSSQNIEWNPALWSLAVEFHCYLWFPLMALAWRRYGVLNTSIVALTAFTAAFFIAPGWRYQDIRFDLYCLFTFGAITAWIISAPGARWEFVRSLPWRLMRNTMAIGFVVLALTGQYFHVISAGIVVNYFIGIWAVVTILSLFDDQPDKLRDFLSSRAAVALGTISYSVYLVHWVVLELALMVAAKVGADWHQVAVAGLLTAMVVPGSLALATVFYFIFERPFMAKQLRPGIERPNLAVIPDGAQLVK